MQVPGLRKIKFHERIIMAQKRSGAYKIFGWHSDGDCKYLRWWTEIYSPFTCFLFHLQVPRDEGRVLMHICDVFLLLHNFNKNQMQLAEICRERCWRKSRDKSTRRFAEINCFPGSEIINSFHCPNKVFFLEWSQCQLMVQTWLQLAKSRLVFDLIS